MFKPLLPVLLFATALPAAADAPVYFYLPSDHYVSDVAAYQGDVIAVGVEASSDIAFRWRMSTNAIEYLGVVVEGSELFVSNDGAQICGTTVGMDGQRRMARWTGGMTWVQLPDLGGSAGVVTSGGFDISGDGLTYAGYSYAGGTGSHAVTWTQAGGLVDRGGPFGDPDSRVFGSDLDGNVLAGRKNVPSNIWQGARWVNGTYAPCIATIGGTPYRFGDAREVNGPGTVIVGTNVMTVGGAQAFVKAWRWDAGTNTTTLLDNLAGYATLPVPTGITADATIIVGENGQNFQADPQAIVWLNNVPQRLDDWLTSLGAAPQFDLEIPKAITDDGAAICGYGISFGGASPPWVVVFPEKLEIGVLYCFGDGTGTACPCSPATVPHGAAGKGCPNSLFASGAKLRATGIASVANDSLVLRGSDMPNGACVYYQGTTRQDGGAGAAFGDGLRCAGGTVRRFATQTNVGNASKYPDVGNNPISVAGLIPGGGQTRTYQGWYRNGNPTFCTAFTFNLTNGVELVWTP